MQSLRIVKRLDVREHISPRFVMRAVLPVMNLGGCIPDIAGSPSTWKERVTSAILVYFRLIIQHHGPVVG